MDEKLKKIIFIVLGAFVIIFLILFIISSCSNKKYTIDKLEIKIVENAKEYYTSHKEELPDENTIISISLQDLVNKEIIDSLDKLMGKDTICSGDLVIENNNNYYMYSPKLNCTNNDKTYKTNNLKELLLKNIVTSGNGLYNLYGEYYFRGDNPNNYIIFDGILWQIMKINEDNSIKLIETGRRDPVVWDDRYNSDLSSTTGLNNFVNENINSRIKDTLDKIYNDKDSALLTENAKGYIRETSLCIGKRGEEETNNDGSIECSTKLDHQYIGLIQLNEYMIASLDNNCINSKSNACSNYNYLANYDNSYWTITGNSDNTSQVYKIYNTVMPSVASNAGMARMVINISENTNVTGSGTEENPYVVSGMSSDLRKLN